MFEEIPRNVWQHSPEYLRTFPGMFDDIPRNVWRHSPECLATFPGMFEDIPWNVWRHYPEYNIPPILRVPRISFPVPVFLFLYIADVLVQWNDFKIFFALSSSFQHMKILSGKLLQPWKLLEF